MIRRPPRSTLFPYPTLSRSCVSHLPLDLRFPEDHGIEPRRDAIQMTHRIAIALGVAVRAGVATTASTYGYTDRKSTRLNSSHGYISYAVFCLKKKMPTVNNPARIARSPPTVTSNSTYTRSGL